MMRRSTTRDADLLRNYAEDVLMFSKHGIEHGHDGVRKSAHRLREGLPNAIFTYTITLTHGEVAFLEWTAEADGAYVDDGADSFVIRDGRIAAQTIHYTVKRRS
jgi:hypothetical protein